MSLRYQSRTLPLIWAGNLSHLEHQYDQMLRDELSLIPETMNLRTHLRMFDRLYTYTPSNINLGYEDGSEQPIWAIWSISMTRRPDELSLIPFWDHEFANTSTHTCCTTDYIAYPPSCIDLGYEDGSEKLRTERARSNNTGYARERTFTRAERHFYARELKQRKMTDAEISASWKQTPNLLSWTPRPFHRVEKIHNFRPLFC